uniref:ATPase subunit 8 n=2 Tax=Rhagovelia TaxID=95678 RepID=A0A5B9XXB0_9HEMI|nr:ATPase subunit 8 [Rhagovelia reitteri]QEH58864.1 ATPase subunit 8 [Rhagovelia reitteri]QEH58965.1 ATPase subunit 8 [Rhagovelia sp. XD-2019]
MPQMSPMWWTSLMIMFTLSFMMVNSMMYFMKKYNVKSKMEKKNQIQKNWKW